MSPVVAVVENAGLTTAAARPTARAASLDGHAVVADDNNQAGGNQVLVSTRTDKAFTRGRTGSGLTPVTAVVPAVPVAPTRHAAAGVPQPKGDAAPTGTALTTTAQTPTCSVRPGSTRPGRCRSHRPRRWTGRCRWPSRTC
ncbi:hypothetical protein [Actinokineospora inagensis]|uniref:hypothetical protein n=1 Tax=Actinokineospora inagensis TaxID=103730 RepID=UPI0003F5B714|nr:hypothetical protein [Actinokineospora inagensis]